ncbi:MAG: ABC transporter ATP-binding protein, partial [Chloroflexi bacterium]|nr:ABC transporter ATP-binding protein [Chloroflexota bacterium]
MRQTYVLPARTVAAARHCAHPGLGCRSGPGDSLSETSARQPGLLSVSPVLAMATPCLAAGPRHRPARCPGDAVAPAGATRSSPAVSRAEGRTHMIHLANDTSQKDTSSNGSCVDLSNLTFAYPHSSAVLQGIDLQLKSGQFILVAGPSGAGKSTLLRALDGLVPHFTGGRISGQVRVHGHDPVAEGPHAMSRVVGLVPQDPEVQFVVDTVEDELAFALENQGLPQSVMHERVERILQQLGLAALRRRRIHALSAGQKQRVAIASVLTLLPQVLVLDEPTSQLDPEAAEDVLVTLRQLNREMGITVILSEHRLERV